MCGRFAIVHDPHDWCARLSVQRDELPPWQPRYNVAPGQSLPVFFHQGDHRALAAMTWGFLPHWHQPRAGGKAPPRPINARVESLDKPYFRDAFAEHRCLIPADGFFEWTAPGKGRSKQPWYAHPRDGQPLLFAGLFSRHLGSDGDSASCAILTRPAAGVLAQIHGRMPLVLPEDAYDAWLDGDRDQARDCVHQFTARDWTLTPVSTHVNNPRHDDPEVLAPLPGAEPDQ